MCATRRTKMRIKISTIFQGRFRYKDIDRIVIDPVLESTIVMGKTKPKNKSKSTRPAIKEIADKPGAGGASAEDQIERGYYYDDSHGYQTYKPDSGSVSQIEKEDE